MHRRNAKKAENTRMREKRDMKSRSAGGETARAKDEGCDEITKTRQNTTGIRHFFDANGSIIRSNPEGNFRIGRVQHEKKRKSIS